MSLLDIDEDASQDIDEMVANISLESELSAAFAACNVPTFSFWCHKCNEMREGICPTHGKPSLVSDRPILSRALASLPSGVRVKMLSDENTKGAFSKRIFPANCIFGPLIAPNVHEHTGSGFKLLVESEEQHVYLNCTEEDKCNWMMFVRPANKWSDVNMMVWEFNCQLYFITIKSIQADLELRVAYSTPYARKYGLELITPESKSFVCEACGQSFSSHIAKAGHQRSAKCKNKGRGYRGARGRRPRAKQSAAEDGHVITEPPSKEKPTSQRGKRLSCPKCFMCFDQTELMTLHMLSHEEEEAGSNVVKDETTGSEMHQCPACTLTVESLPSLLQHINSEHKKRARKPVVNSDDASESDLVMDIGETRGIVDAAESEQHNAQQDGSYCKVCNKVLRSAGALSAHMRSHYRPKKSFYGCFLCDQKFSSSRSVLEHVKTHAVNGFYHCPKCPHRVYESWKKCRKHINSLHSGKEFPCTVCGKVFCRSDKLRLHMFIHTNIKEFMCDQCGKQFNRKDKLQDHIQRLHSEHSDAAVSRRLSTKVPQPEYHNYIFKCRDCSRGFKRRGMLINHLAKAHPAVALSSIPELNIPLLRTQRDYFCMHCNKTYKSSSKRRLHILKNHPGCEIPPGLKNKEFPDLCTYSQPIANISMLPYACESCHKQYANKAKLTEHKRHKHPELFFSIDKSASAEAEINEQAELTNSEVVALIHPLENGANDSISISLHGLTDTDRVDNIDLLTQAMSANELQPSLHFSNQSHGMSSNPIHLGLNEGNLNLRLLPNSNIDLSSLQITNINSSTLTFAAPITSVATTQSIQQNALSNTIDSPNLNSVAPHASPRTAWPYQYKLN